MSGLMSVAFSSESFGLQIGSWSQWKIALISIGFAAFLTLSHRIDLLNLTNKHIQVCWLAFPRVWCMVTKTFLHRFKLLLWLDRIRCNENNGSDWKRYGSDPSDRLNSLTKMGILFIIIVNLSASNRISTSFINLIETTLIETFKLFPRSESTLVRSVLN